jgi:hypothetical protein
MTKTIIISDETYKELDGVRVIDLINNTEESDEETIRRLIRIAENESY